MNDLYIYGGRIPEGLHAEQMRGPFMGMCWLWPHRAARVQRTAINQWVYLSVSFWRAFWGIQ